jgi:ubiquinone/menaquinone biosynthesis C-methylase UbiE
MIETASGESICDYSQFDFRALWKGREQVTRVETAILEECLRDADHRQILEVGTGFGRLLGSLTQEADEVVALDFDAGSLGRLTLPLHRARVLRVAANLYHLPFSDATFTAATLIRVYHHLDHPAKAMEELGRVLGPAGRLVLSFSPRPTVGTLAHDVKHALAASGRQTDWTTFGRSGRAQTAGPFPIYVPTLGEFRATTAAAGFATEREFVTGLEEYAVLRRLPASWFVRIGVALGKAPAFPTRFTVLTKSGRAVDELRAPEQRLACPACRAPQPSWGTSPGLRCTTCGFEGRRHGDVLDLRFAPTGAVRWGPGA